MRIRGSDLRRIIKEEIRRSALREQPGDPFGLDDDSDAEEKLTKLMRTLDDPLSAVDLDEPTASSAAMPSAMSSLASSSPMSVIIDMLIARGADKAQIREVEAMLPRIIDGLDRVYNGELVVKMGDRGPLVKALQILIRASLSEYLDAVTPQIRSIFLRDFANDAIDALGNAYAMTPDGVYGSDTSDAVKAVQKAMNVMYRLLLLSGGGPDAKMMQNPVKIDGRIGRQTLQFLMGRVGAQISRVPVQDITDKSMLLRFVSGMSPDAVVAKLLGPDPDPKAAAELVATSLGAGESGATALLGLIRAGGLDPNFEGMSMEDLQVLLDSLPKGEVLPTAPGGLKPSTTPREDIKIDLRDVSPPPPVRIPDVEIPVRLPESRRRR